MGSMAQDAIAAGLDSDVGPDGREWCESRYKRPAINIEIWGEDDCHSFLDQSNKIDLDRHIVHSDYQENEVDYFSSFQEAAS